MVPWLKTGTSTRQVHPCAWHKLDMNWNLKGSLAPWLPILQFQHAKCHVQCILRSSTNIHQPIYGGSHLWYANKMLPWCRSELQTSPQYPAPTWNCTLKAVLIAMGLRMIDEHVLGPWCVDQKLAPSKKHLLQVREHQLKPDHNAGIFFSVLHCEQCSLNFWEHTGLTRWMFKEGATATSQRQHVPPQHPLAQEK